MKIETIETIEQAEEANKDVIIQLQYLQQAYGSIMQQKANIVAKLKKEPFNPAMIESRDKIKETLSEMETIMLDLAKIINNNLRERYSVDLIWLSK